MRGHLFALKELVLGVHLPNLLLLPPRQIQGAHVKLARDGIERPPPPLKHTPCSSQEAILPARGVADADFAALAARLPDVDHRERRIWSRFGSGREVKTRDVRQILAAPNILVPQFQFLR